MQQGEVTWRVPIAGSGVLSIIVMAFIFTLPESPRWFERPLHFLPYTC